MWKDFNLFFHSRLTNIGSFEAASKKPLTYLVWVAPSNPHPIKTSPWIHPNMRTKSVSVVVILHPFPRGIRIGNITGINFLIDVPKGLFSYYQIADPNTPAPRRTFIMEDPYDDRHGFKVTEVRHVLLHSAETDRDAYTREKLDIIFG